MDDFDMIQVEDFYNDMYDVDFSEEELDCDSKE